MAKSDVIVLSDSRSGPSKVRAVATGDRVELAEIVSLTLTAGDHSELRSAIDFGYRQLVIEL